MDEARKASRFRTRAKLAKRLAEEPTLGTLPGRMAPHALRSERAIVAAALVQPTAFFAQVARARHCYSEAHRRALEAVEGIHKKGDPVTLRAVVAWLRDTSKIGGARLAQVGGVEGLSEIVTSSTVRSPSILQAMGVRVVDAWKRRAHLDGLRRAAAQLFVDLPLDHDGIAYVDDAPRVAVVAALGDWLRAVEADGRDLESARASLERGGDPSGACTIDYIRAARIA